MMIRLNRDPDGEGGGGAAGDFDASKYSADNMPQTKKEWDQLKEADSSKWGELTQSNIDNLYRQNKELTETNTGLNNQANNLTQELEIYKLNQQTVEAPAVPTTPKAVEGNEHGYSQFNLPQGDKAWDEFFEENPRLATDLRTYQNQSISDRNKDFAQVQYKSKKVVQAEHPDMYLYELEANGQPKRDESGKAVLKLGTDGEPIFNPVSEKGKLWDAIYNENPDIRFQPDAPELMMTKMERRLKMKGAATVENAQEQERQKQVEEGQVVTDGVPPPVKSSGTFASDEERARVQAAIGRGVYKNEQDYFNERDNPTMIQEEGRTPTFSKK